VLRARDVVLAIGSYAPTPDIPGIDEIEAWDNRAATATRELPRSLVILGGGPSGTELAQVYGRYGVPVTLVDPNERILPRDHPRSSALVREAL
jgi:pyruvate/2-oxoglutarate dehydrogenase complex dihydrolipoamide dehydrogenase (E3) component